MIMTRRLHNVDTAIIGAGFGGLGAALALAERGVEVAVCETLRYPGGCASTFHHGRHRFESGATLFSGFADGQLFRRWIDRHSLDVEIEWPDPVVQLRTPGFRLEVPPRRAAMVDRVCGLPGAEGREDAVRRFFDHQRRVADALWPLLDDPELLPPWTGLSLLRHARRLPAYLPVARFLGRPVAALLEHYGLGDVRALRTYLDAVCRITVQCGADEAEAAFALSAMDYWLRGTGHVRGGIGRLARAIARAVERLGGEVRYTDRVRSLEPTADGGYRLRTRRGVIEARTVVANLLPQALEKILVGLEVPDLRRIARRVETGWGACMVYRVALAPLGISPGAHHFELVRDPAEPLIEGNHVFVSVCGQDDGHAPPGYRAVTASSHVSADRIRRLSCDEQAHYVGEVQARMKRTLGELLPEWGRELRHEMTASPRTFERFTGRPRGWVGGVPRRAGLGAYMDLLRPPKLPRGLHLVGDSVFPGQSTLATALGGQRTAIRIVQELGLERRRATHAAPADPSPDRSSGPRRVALEVPAE